MTPTDLSTTQAVLDWAQQCEPAESPYGDHRRAQHEGRLQSDIEIAATIARAMRVADPMSNAPMCRECRIPQCTRLWAFRLPMCETCYALEKANNDAMLQSIGYRRNKPISAERMVDGLAVLTTMEDAVINGSAWADCSEIKEIIRFALGDEKWATIEARAEDRRVKNRTP